MRRGAGFGVLVFGIVAALVLLFPGGRAGAASPARIAVATEHPLSTEAALTILEQGGNAVDAAVAAALVAGVVNPVSSGIGGGGFALVLRPGARTPEILDFRETAPAAVDRAALDRRPLPPEERGHLVGVPGEVKGLHELVRRYGSKAWPDVVAPAESRARRGFAVGKHLARVLSGKFAGALKNDPGLVGLYFPGGRPALEGRVIKNPKLAATLGRIAAEGPSAFYDGTIAQDLVEATASAGGTLTLEDLRGYSVRDRKPLRVRYAGHDVFTMPLPSAGGLLLAQTLLLFTPEELRRLGWGTGPFMHLVAEGFRAAIADRFQYAGDPDLVPVDAQRLLDAERLAERRRKISLDRTHAIPRFVGGDHGTHHLSVMDANGMVVSLTTTVNRTFGAKIVAPKSGVVLNDELDDFTEPKDLATLGLPHGPNLPRPFARPVSSMTPTIVLRDGKPVLALGGSGGMTIPTNVTQLLLGALVFDMTPEALVAARRFYMVPRGPTMFIEAGAEPALLEDLAFRGEIVATMPFTTSAVQLVAQRPDGAHAAADPRKLGSAAVRAPRATQ